MHAWQAALGEWRAAWRRYEKWECCGLPKRFRNRSLSTWRPRSAQDRGVLAAAQSWLAKLDDGAGLVLLGPPGTGKTHLFAGLVTIAISEAGADARYVYLPDLLGSMRSAFGREGGDSAHGIEQRLRSADVMFLDEIGLQRATDWEREFLSSLIDDRYRNCRPFALAGNAAPDALPTLLGSRAADRLAECAMVLHLAGPSRRAEAATDTELRSAEPALLPPPDEVRCQVYESGRYRTFAEQRNPAPPTPRARHTPNPVVAQEIAKIAQMLRVDPPATAEGDAHSPNQEGEP